MSIIFIISVIVRTSPSLLVCKIWVPSDIV